MKEHVDFVEQKQELGEGVGKPDITVKLPGDRVVYIDAKVPWANYQAMVTTDDAGQRADIIHQLAERGIDVQGDAFAPQASALPGSEDENEFTARGWLQTEIWPLFLFSVGGMLIFPVANDFLTLFVALEVMSLPLYLLAGMARRRRLLSQEAAMKYFVLGAFSSAFLLYGAALRMNSFSLPSALKRRS